MTKKFVGIRIESLIWDQVRKAAIAHNEKIGDFVLRCIIEYFDVHDEKIEQAFQKKIMAHDNKETRKNFFFFKNGMNELFRETSWQIRSKGTYDHARVKHLISIKLQEYECFDDATKKFLRKEKEEYEQLKDETKMNRLLGLFEPPPKVIR